MIVDAWTELMRRLDLLHKVNKSNYKKDGYHIGTLAWLQIWSNTLPDYPIGGGS